MPKFRKKPVVVEAMQWIGGPWDVLDDFCGMNWGRADAKDVAWLGPDDPDKVVLWNQVERQWLCCPKTWWIIRGVRGELYPCAPWIFAETYERVETRGAERVSAESPTKSMVENSA